MRYFYLYGRVVCCCISICTFLLGCIPEKTGPVIGISFETLQTEYWVASVEAIKAECRKNEVDYLVAVANGDANRQFDQVNTFIARGVDGIIIAPKDAHTIIPVIKAANRADVPIVIYNRIPAENKGTYTTIVADNYDISKNTVRYMCELAQQSGRKNQALIMVGDLGDINAVNRRKGFLEAIEEYPDAVELVAEVPTEWNQEKALAGVTNALQAHPAISFIFSSSDFLFPSVISALKTAGKYHPIGHDKHVILGGFDGDNMAYKMLGDQYLDADGVQDVFYECSASVQAILQYMKGEPVKELIVDPGFVIHQNNFEQKASDMWGAQFE